MYWVGMGVVYGMFFLTGIIWSNFQPNYTVSLIIGLLAIPLLASLFALVSKRLHDLGISAWWWVGVNVVMFVSMALRSAIAEQIMTAVVGGGLLLLGCFKGTSGPNRFSDLSEISSPR
jgi:uncharacterized membrane protein YhaH (DUF805 family)